MLNVNKNNKTLKIGVGECVCVWGEEFFRVTREGFSEKVLF